MKLQSYELYEVPPRWLFLELTTTDETVGWGEPIVEGRTKTVKAAVEELIENYLFETDLLQTEDLWQAMYRGGYFRGGPILMSAIAGIDQALWDIKGKHYDMPVYEMLGGQSRQRVRTYQWAGGEHSSDVSNEAANLISSGYTAVKIDAVDEINYIETPSHLEEIVQRVEKVRKTIGNEYDICVDFRGRVRHPMAQRLVEALEDYDLLFIEEPVPPEHHQYLPQIVGRSSVPIATGDRVYSRWDCRPLCEQGWVDVIQPDVSHAGGISEVMRIASLAEVYDISIALNCPIGPIAFAASLQLAFTIPNFLILDHGFYNPLHNDESGTYLENLSDFSIRDGHLSIPDKPGLGIEINQQQVEEKSMQEINWQIPLRRHSDGSVAGW